MSGRCEPCAAGSYQDREGQLACKPCPHGLRGVGIEAAKSVGECGGVTLSHVMNLMQPRSGHRSFDAETRTPHPPIFIYFLLRFACSALTLLVGRQKGIRPVKTERWGAGVVMCSFGVHVPVFWTGSVLQWLLTKSSLMVGFDGMAVVLHGTRSAETFLK